MLHKGSLFLKKKKKPYILWRVARGRNEYLKKMNIKMVLSISFVHHDVVFDLAELRHIWTHVRRILHTSKQIFSPKQRHTNGNHRLMGKLKMMFVLFIVYPGQRGSLIKTSNYCQLRFYKVVNENYSSPTSFTINSIKII